MLQFNHKGNLVPNVNIKSDLAELTAFFVDSMASETRKELFDKYLLYSNNLKRNCNQQILQWINGSFCTLKNAPGDIDIVSFIPHEIIDSNEKLFRQFSHPNSEKEYGVDAYIVKIFNEDRRLFPQYWGDRLYWLEKFTRTKLNRAYKRESKGFLEIIF